jgi:hypothetical protein
VQSGNGVGVAKAALRLALAVMVGAISYVNAVGMILGQVTQSMDLDLF